MLLEKRVHYEVLCLLSEVSRLPTAEEKKNPKCCSYYRMVDHSPESFYTFRNIFNWSVKKVRPYYKESMIKPMKKEKAQWGGYASNG